MVHGIYVKDHSHSKRGNTISIKHSLYFLYSLLIYILYSPFLRQDSTYYGLCYTSRGTLPQREKSQCVHHEGSIGRPISPWGDALPLSYISLPLFVNTSTPWLSGLKTLTTHEVQIDLLIIGYWSLLLLARDAVPCKSVRLWCDGSSDRSFLVDPLSYFSCLPVRHDWFNKGRGMYYPVCK